MRDVHTRAVGAEPGGRCHYRGGHDAWSTVTALSPGSASEPVPRGTVQQPDSVPRETVQLTRDTWPRDERALQEGPAMTDPGERLRSSLAADQSSGPSYGMADFDSPIAMEAMRATRVLHAADQDPFPAAEPDPGHHDRQPEGRRRQDHVHGEPGRRARPLRAAHAGHRPRPAGQLRARPSASSTPSARPRSTTPWSATARWPRSCTRRRPARSCAASRRRSTWPAPRSSWSRSSPASTGCAAPIEAYVARAARRSSGRTTS